MEDANALFFKFNYHEFSRPAVIILSYWMIEAEEREKIVGKEWCVYV